MEEQAIGLGKWARAGVPHKGWVCVSLEDIGTSDHVCEMCERTYVRYVHTMEHTDFPDALRCGCVCAGHMEENLAAARDRESTVKSSARRRKSWPKRKGWRRSDNGNLHIKVDGYRVTVFRRSGTFSAVISSEQSEFKRFSRRTYASEGAAQLATFDALQFAKARAR